MLHPHKVKCFHLENHGPVCALEVRELLRAGAIEPEELVSTTDGEAYFARQVGNFAAPRFLQINDPLVGDLPDLPESIDFNGIIESLPDGFFEEMPMAAFAAN